MKDKIAEARKFVTATIGAVATALTLGLLHGNAEKWAVVGIAFATAIGVYRVPND